MERRTIQLHGHQVAYRTAGSGPVILLIHGMAGSSDAWEAVIDDLSAMFTVVAPDLPGHGQSDKPRGDYSLGAQASFLRDLGVALGHDRATVVGNSLGGGIAMQFAYQYPERCERLVLVGSGGLGEEVMPILRALAIPGVDLVLPLAFQPVIISSLEKVGGWFSKFGVRLAPSHDQMWQAFASLSDADTRTAFVQTLRSVVDTKGQRVSALNRIYLTVDLPTLIIWGADDPVIPVSHAFDAHLAMPGSRLEVIEECGHFPHAEKPRIFTELLLDFLASTSPAEVDPDLIARRMKELTPAA